MLAKKVCNENRKKERYKNDGRFIQGDQGDESGITKSYKSMEILKEDKWQRFIVGDIDSMLIEGTINVLN